MGRSDYNLTADELQQKSTRRRRWIIISVAAVIVGALAIVAARPTRDAIKGWQARRHAQKAFAYIEQANWNEARAEAVAAYQLRPGEPEALRAVARFLSRTRQSQALDFWSQLASKSSLTHQDRRDEAAIALISGEMERAGTAVKELLATEVNAIAPMDWLLAAQLALQKGQLPEALTYLRDVSQSGSATERERLQAAVLMLQAANTGGPDPVARQQDEAWSQIVGLARGTSASSLDALMVLAHRALSRPAGTGVRPSAEASGPGSDTSEQKSELSTSDLATDEIIRRLESHPLAKTSHKLTALDLRMHAAPATKEECITRAIADRKDGDSDSLVTLATWLNGKGEFQRQLDTISLERALQTRELFLQHVDALGALDRWDEIKRLLESERFPIDAVVQRMYLARCNAQLGNVAAANNNWQRALEGAAGEPAKLISLAEYAEKNGAMETADSAYTQAAAAAPKFRLAQQGRLRAAQAARETNRMHAVLAEMLQLWPNDTAIQNDEAYTRLLLLGQATSNPQLPTPPDSSEELTAVEKLAERLMQREPASLPHRTLLALARLRLARPAAALEVYEGIQVTPRALSPSALAVHAAVLQASGHIEEARAEIANARSESLLPEEQALIANLRE